MPFLIPAIIGIGGWLGWKANNAADAIKPPAGLPSGGSNLDLTKIAGYAIAGGLIYYFGKKIIK